MLYDLTVLCWTVYSVCVIEKHNWIIRIKKTSMCSEIIIIIIIQIRLMVFKSVSWYSNPSRGIQSVSWYQNQFRGI